MAQTIVQIKGVPKAHGSENLVVRDLHLDNMRGLNG